MENRTNSNISHQIPGRVIEADSSLARDIRLKRLRAKTCTPCRRGIPPLTTQEAEHDQRKIGEPGRVRRDERRHGIEHQEDGERRQRDALRQGQPRNGGVEPGLMRGDLLHQLATKAAERDSRDVIAERLITVSMAAAARGGKSRRATR